MISIIVPNYNYARYLKERMDSIFAQTYQDYEIILLDDASTDESAELLREYAQNPKVSSLTINEKNSGSPFLQWKRGIEKAKGEYVWIAEADDKASPTFLQRCVEALDANPKAVIALTGSQTIDENGNPGTQDYDAWKLKRHRKRAANREVVVFDGREYALHNQLWGNHVYNASGTVFRRSAFDGNRNFEPCYSMRNLGDYLFWTVMMEKGDVIEVYEKLNFFRRHSISQSAQGLKKGVTQTNVFYEQLTIMDYMFRTFRPGRYRKLIIRGEFYKCIYRNRLPKEEKREIYREAKRRTGVKLSDFIIARVHKFLWLFCPKLIAFRTDRV